MERKWEKWNTVPYEAAFVFPQTSLSSQCYYETGNAREHAFKPYCRGSIAFFFKKEVLNLSKKKHAFKSSGFICQTEDGSKMGAGINAFISLPRTSLTQIGA